MAKHKFTICAFVDFDIELPVSFIAEEAWPDIYRRGVEEAIRMIYLANVTTTIMPKGLN